MSYYVGDLKRDPTLENYPQRDSRFGWQTHKKTPKAPSVEFRVKSGSWVDYLEKFGLVQSK